MHLKSYAATQRFVTFDSCVYFYLICFCICGWVGVSKQGGNILMKKLPVNALTRCLGKP